VKAGGARWSRAAILTMETPMRDFSESEGGGAAMVTALDELAMAAALLRMAAAPGADPSRAELAYLANHLCGAAAAALEQATETPGADVAENVLASAVGLCGLLRAAASGPSSVDCGALASLAYALDVLTAMAGRAPSGGGARAA